MFLAIVVTLTLGTGIGYILNDGENSTTKSVAEIESPDIEFVEDKVPTADDIKPDENGMYTETQVAQLVSPSVVTIYTYNEDSSKGSVSSGVIIDESGYVITNDHIYSEIANAKFVVTLYNDISYPATFVAGDQKSDIAVIKIEGASGLTPASFGKSDEVKAGDKVIAIGTPNGFSNSVTAGIVSAANRRIRNTATGSGSTQTTATYTMRVIQTDTSLNHGNSGGALVNMKGQVVGINSSKIVLESYEGICFATPSNDAVKVAKSLIKNKKVVGIMGGKDSNAYNNNSLRSKVYRDVDSQLRREFGIKTYKAIKRNQCDKAIEIVENYQLPVCLKEQIDNENAQMRFDI